MIPLPLTEVEPLGRLKRAGDATEATGVQIDSRRIERGDLFVAVGAGADFREEALQRGAAATLVPADPFAAMAAIGSAVRRRTAARIVGITGSAGKTSTKDILASLCRPHVRTVAAERSYNAELGVPLTLCRLEPDTELGILELAMRGLGQIAELCRIAQPGLGVITTIGPAHLELVGSLEGVTRAKAELLDALPRGAVAIVPAAARGLQPYLRADLDVRTFGTGGDSTLDEVTTEGERSRAVFSVRGERVELELPFSAAHQIENTLAALTTYEALGLPLERAQAGAAQIAFSAWRGEEMPLPGGGILINDCWNANPISMRAALRHLDERAAGRRRVAVLGDMAELGSDAPGYHAEIGALADDLRLDALLAVGQLAAGYLEATPRIDATRWSATAEEAVAQLDELVQPGDIVLVKGSRAVGLEAVAEALTMVKA